MGFWKVTGEIGTYGIWLQLIVLPIIIIGVIIGLIIYNTSYKPPPDKKSEGKNVINIVGSIILVVLSVTWTLMYYFRKSPGLKNVVGLGTEVELATPLLAAL